MVNWAITGGCNSKCAFCEVPNQLDMSKDLGFDRFVSLVGELVDFGIKRVHLVGGEVFMRKDVWDIFKLIHSTGISITITTNALVIPKLSNEKLRLLDENVDRIRISLDTTDKAQYKVIRGVDGFDSVICSLEVLSKLNRATVVITSVVTNDTLGEIPKLIKMAKKYGIGFVDFQPVSPITIFTDTFAEKKDDFLLKSDKDFERLSKYLDEGIRVSKKLGVPTTLPLFKIYGYHYFKNITKIDKFFFFDIVNKFNCIKLFKSVFIDYDGSLKPCPVLPSIGNIKEGSFKDELKKADKLKKEFRKGNYPHLCNSCFCNPGENIVFSFLNNPFANFKVLKSLIFSR